MAQSSIDNLDKKLLKLNTLEEKIEYLVAEGDIPSLVAGIVVNDSLVWNRGWGASAVDTIYPIDSIGKSFTATAILRLYERNLIELDDDVNNIPFNIRHPEYPDKSITIRMLLSHQSRLAHACELRLLREEIDPTGIVIGKARRRCRFFSILLLL